ncbi:MAG: substrate-binding domain-containing protein [Planctomycetaceae bacterium]
MSVVLCGVAVSLPAMLAAQVVEGPAASPGAVSPADPYLPRDLVGGSLSLSGSRTMGQLATVWTDGFQHLHPEFESELDVRGSETAFDRLAGERPAVGLLSRSLDEAEQANFAKAHPGERIVAVQVAIDAVAVIVHPENPITHLTLEELRTLFAATDGAAVTWGNIGLEGEWAEAPVNRYLPDENSGSRGQFAALVLGDASFASAQTHGSHSRIVEAVAQDRTAIGVVSRAHAQSETVRALALSRRATETPRHLEPDSIASGQYPLTRPLSIVVVLNEQGMKSSLVEEFMRYVLSRSGQEDVVKDGFQPLSRAELLEQYDRLGWNQLK